MKSVSVIFPLGLIQQYFIQRWRALHKISINIKLILGIDIPIELKEVVAELIHHYIDISWNKSSKPT
jgi:hypothetical protein